MSALQPFGRLAGRLLLVLILIGSGFSKIGGSALATVGEIDRAANR